MLEGLVVGAGLMAIFTFASWTVYLFVKTELVPSADLTSRMLWHVGRGCCWAGAVLVAGGLFAAVVTGGVRILGGGR